MTSNLGSTYLSSKSPSQPGDVLQIQVEYQYYQRVYSCGGISLDCVPSASSRTHMFAEYGFVHFVRSPLEDF